MTKDENAVRSVYARLARSPEARPAVSLGDGQRAVLQAALAAPAMNALLDGLVVRVSADADFMTVDSSDGLVIGVGLLADAAPTVFWLRSGVELLAWRKCARDEGQTAAATLFALHSSLACLDGMAPADRGRVLDAGPDWLSAAYRTFTDAYAERRSAIAIVRALAAFLPCLRSVCEPGSYAYVDDEIIERVAAGLAVAQPTERLLTLGGDERLRVAEDTRLNRYGCSPSPRPWAITFSTCTASSISTPGYLHAEAQRRALFAAALEGRLTDGFAAAMASTRRQVAEVLNVDRIPGARVLLAPSGTDAELFAVFCAMAVADRPVLNILVAPREIGSGSRHAAAGCHFDRTTPLGGAVQPGSPVEGLTCDRIRVQELELRDKSGQPVPDEEVESRLRALVRSGMEAGEAVLVHLLDSSKTGLGAPSLECLAELQEAYGKRLAVIVDAAQLRVSRANLAAYLRQGFYILVTGSKFFTGPPFAGALLIPPAVSAAVRDVGPFPRGFGCYASRWDVPEEWQAQATRLSASPNFGLLLRWQAALWEMEAFFAADAATRHRIFREFADALERRASDWPCIELLPPCVYRRAAGAECDSWDSVPTIFSFLVRRPGGFLTYDEAVSAYHWLNTDISDCLPPRASSAERRLAGRCGHIGQPVKIRFENGVWLGALRIAPGARLVSRVCFDPTIGAEVDERLAQQVDAACTVLDKLELICKYWDDLKRSPVGAQELWPLAPAAFANAS